MNSAPALPLHIDAFSPIPIHIQLREQLKCLIGSGFVRIGDNLPPASELAQQLDLNRNTVISVYNQLSKEDYVRIRKGAGTQVIENPRTHEDREMLALIRGVLHNAGGPDFDREQMPVSLLAFRQIRKSLVGETSRILFVEFHPNEYLAHKSEIDVIPKAEVSRTAIDSLTKLTPAELAEKLAEFDMVVTPYAGLKDISELTATSGIKIVAVGDIPY
ncbi:GntR family transcriptional regulator [Cohnella faecalis]|uniref:GntR family transcriptional regulator n=1 Tax=Cohnella faecalis TaxID=2315694 RepID=A0A398CLX1_9BACL|nr:GntR family transcriptional regulator [Cohnella faecalis]RIE03242.1 GntR family transcriptional regulator [Cohnella faecalis]